jgi:hypothetical protein
VAGTEVTWSHTHTHTHTHKQTTISKNDNEKNDPIFHSTKKLKTPEINIIIEVALLRKEALK